MKQKTKIKIPATRKPLKTFENAFSVASTDADDVSDDVTDVQKLLAKDLLLHLWQSFGGKPP